MNYTEIKYNELERIIFSLNFRLLSTEGEQKVFKHPNGALIILPHYLDNQLVSETHLVAISRILDEFDIINKLDFSVYLEKALSSSLI
ncbi:MAG: hypothetical protein QNJ37_21875 [Crocosphaera sp.]|nr:hypothetical protein [Crocosphaera sp.]